MYSQTCAIGHLWKTATFQQRPARIPCPTKCTKTLPRILDQTLNSGHPLNNGHFLGSQGWPLCTGLTVFKYIWWFSIYFELFRKNYFGIFFRADHDYIELRVQVKEEVEDDDKSESGDLKIVEQVRFK